MPICHNHSFIVNSARGSRKGARARYLSFADSSEAMQIRRYSVFGFFLISFCITLDLVLEVKFCFDSLSNGSEVFRFPSLFLHVQHEVFSLLFLYKKLNDMFHFKSLLKLKIFQSFMIVLNNFNLKKDS